MVVYFGTQNAIESRVATLRVALPFLVSHSPERKLNFLFREYYVKTCREGMCSEFRGESVRYIAICYVSYTANFNEINLR